MMENLFGLKLPSENGSPSTAPAAKSCPQCHLINPGSAQRCDCGYDFSAQCLKESYLEAARAEGLPLAPLERRFVGFVIDASILFLVSWYVIPPIIRGNWGNTPLPDDSLRSLIKIVDSFLKKVQHAALCSCAVASASLEPPGVGLGLGPAVLAELGRGRFGAVCISRGRERLGGCDAGRLGGRINVRRLCAVKATHSEFPRKSAA